MFKIIPFKGVVMRITGSDPKGDYIEGIAISETGQEVKVHIPELDTDLDLDVRAGIKGKGYYATGVSDYFGMSERTQMFFFTDWEFYESFEDWWMSSTA